MQGYEERKYPSVMYACTEMTYDTPDDEEGEEWSLEKVMKWMTNKKSWKEKPQSKMFMKLFRYIAGVNKESQEIEMTVPVWSKMVVSEKVSFVLKVIQDCVKLIDDCRTKRPPKICVFTSPKNSNQTPRSRWTPT